jgi:hypothetical protein
LPNAISTTLPSGKDHLKDSGANPVISTLTLFRNKTKQYTTDKNKTACCAYLANYILPQMTSTVKTELSSTHCSKSSGAGYHGQQG